MNFKAITFISRVGILIIVIFILDVFPANAALLNWTTDENITLSDPAITFTILANSTSDSLTVKTNRIDVTIAANERFLLQSPRLLSISGASAQASIGFLCRAGFITELDFRSGGVSQSITITPQSTTCSGGGGGGGGSGGVSVGGGGGGGGGGPTGVSPAPQTPVAVTAPAIQLPVAVIAPAQKPRYPAKKIKPQKKTAVVTSGFSFRKILKRGYKGKDVIELQKFLVANNFLIMPPKTPYGFLGQSTEDAVKLFQEQYGIAQKGQAGYGLIGPVTRKKLNQFLGR